MTSSPPNSLLILISVLFVFVYFSEGSASKSLKPSIKPTIKPTYQQLEVNYCPANSYPVKGGKCDPYCYTEPYGICDCVNCDASCYDVAVTTCDDGYSCFPYETTIITLGQLPICPVLNCKLVTTCSDETPPSCYQTEECCEADTGFCHTGSCPTYYYYGCERTYCEHSETETCEGINYPFPCRSGCSCNSERTVCDYSTCCKCNPGYYSTGTEWYSDCLPCPFGSNSTVAGQRSCPCLPGYTSSTGYGPCSPIPTSAPSKSRLPSRAPTAKPSRKPSIKPSAKPSPQPTALLSSKPSVKPSPKPCDPGFFFALDTKVPTCYPCLKGSYSPSPGAVGGCPCLPGYTSSTGFGPCFRCLACRQ